MAIKLEFCNVVVPIEKIRQKLGEEILTNRYSTNTDFCWHDGLLFREGCMNDYDLSDMLDYWEENGFDLIEIIDGQKYWKDVCVVNSGYGPSYPCEWIEYDKGKNIAWLKSQEPGEAIGPQGRSL